MLTSLSVENFALIDKLSIDFSGGFSTITGETGAGKSILLGALGLALGKRADLSSLKNKSNKCVIEASFALDGYGLQTLFEENGLDYDDDTIIRREILPSGKSRAFVNDTPCNLQELQQISGFLIDIHSQHETRELTGQEFQFEIIDSLAGNANVLSLYKKALKHYKDAMQTLENQKLELRESLKVQDYNFYLLEELLAANLVEGEQENLELEAEKLGNVEMIRENFARAVGLADNDQNGITANLKEYRTVVQKLAPFSEEYAALSERLQSLVIEFNDIAYEISDSAEKLALDPERLEFVENKLQSIYSLQKKHQVTTVGELIAIREELDQKALSVSGLENEIARSEATIAQLRIELNKLGDSLTGARSLAIPQLDEKLTAILQQLGMPSVRFKIGVESKDQYFANGKDELSFLFSANKGSDFGLLKKVASGGEMSRIMLAVKSVLSRYSKLPTLIFDEIDTGVSGEIANRMGDIMKEMSNEMQVFAITHLPQIAAKGDVQYKVFKTLDNNTTQTELKLLDDDQRITEIAQMLSGSAVSDSAINHAKALLN